MKGFELTEEKTRLDEGVVGSARWPVQIVWGELDHALRVDTYGAIARELAPKAPFDRLPGKHFLQEDQAGPLAELIARHAERARSAHAS